MSTDHEVEKHVCSIGNSRHPLKTKLRVTQSIPVNITNKLEKLIKIL
tara:strand:+ start:628 stop:768 length:141 start_codon:yes stop_codon:yes gene_type:complete